MLKKSKRIISLALCIILVIAMSIPAFAAAADIPGGVNPTTLNVNYTPTEMRVFDPSNARATFLNIYNTVCATNEKYIDIYKNSDRRTGALKSINFANYDSE